VLAPSARRAARPVLLVTGATMTVLLSGCGSTAHQAGSSPANPGTSTPAVHHIVAAVRTCPLRGTTSPSGVPGRPALAVKIGNDSAALPQSGLNDADIVFEEPIEGAITRLLAVYQCKQAPVVGPVRSTRWIDAQLLPELHHPAFGFAGGIDPDEQLIAAGPFDDLNFTRDYGAYYRASGRYAPQNLFTSTATLWKLDPATAIPAPLFHYATTPPAGQATASVALVWSSFYSVGWTYTPSTATWARSQDGAPDADADGARLTATNVVVLQVHTYPGPYVEDATGSHGVHSVTTGSGNAWVLRNGRTIRATWKRATVNQPITLLDNATGGALPLAPGETWVELLPDTGSITLTPAG
jgi:hypothetical protein